MDPIQEMKREEERMLPNGARQDIDHAILS
jgi:hypothetical protein